MIWLLGGYLYLYIHRPFEIWDILGSLQIERAYMLLMIVFWLTWPGKVMTNNRLHLALVLMFGTIWMSWMMSPFPEDGYTILENYAKLMVFYGLLVTSVRHDRDVHRLLLCLAGAYSIYVLHSFREYLGGRYGYAQGVQRMMGVDVTYSDPNQFATAILLGLPLLYALFWESGLLGRLFLAGVALLTALSIFLTCSRAGMIGLGFFLFLLVCFSKKRLLGMAGLVVLGLIVFAILPGHVVSRLMTLVDPDAGPNNAQDSAAGRLAGLYKGIELFGIYPLAGAGPGSFAAAAGHGFQAHNLYGQVAGELGLIGILALTLLLFTFFANWSRACRLARDYPVLLETSAFRMLRAVQMGVWVLLLNGMAGHTLYRYNWIWLAGFQAVALRLIQEQALSLQAAHQASAATPSAEWEPLPEQPLHHPGWGY